MAKINLKGQKFSRLLVIEENGKNNRNEVLWSCKCDCGNITNVTTYKLRKGITKSCGCFMVDSSRERMRKLGENNKKHGMSNTRIYKIYRGMRDRCLNKNDMHFKDYGERGIKVCDEWINSFEAFYEWSMKNGYDEKLTLDRIDVNGNYEPNNCRWADNIIQSNNKRDNVYYTYNGKTQTVSQWAREYNLKEGTLRARISRYNMSFEEAINLSNFECRSLARGKKINVINIENGEVLTYNSLKNACKDLDTDNSYSRILHCSKNNKIYLNKYKIESI